MIKATAILLALAIVGFGGDPGNAARAGNGSFVVEVRRNYFFFKTHLCNGALIDPQWVLVPAKCVTYFHLFGTYDVAVGSRIFQTDKIIVHEDYNNFAHDLALIRLSNKATFENTGARPVKIPPSNSFQTGEVILYTRNTSGLVVPSVIRINDLSACSHAGKVSASHICAGDNNSVAVKDDEGSPITIFYDGQGETVVGLLSYAKSHPAPAIYTRLSLYSTWIWVKQVIGSL